MSSCAMTVLHSTGPESLLSGTSPTSIGSESATDDDNDDDLDDEVLLMST